LALESEKSCKLLFSYVHLNYLPFNLNVD